MSEIDLTTTYLGLKLANPLVPSSSPLTRELDSAKRLEDAGASALVLPSLFSELEGQALPGIIDELKQVPYLSEIVIGINSVIGDIERAVTAGTDDFLCKPVNKLALVKRVEAMLQFKDIKDENERLRQYIQQMEDSGGPS